VKIALLAACVLAAVPGVRAQDIDRLLYTRADVASAATGEVSLRRAYARRIQLPSESCEEGKFRCATQQFYGQVYLLDFVEETALRGEGGNTTNERVDRGRLAIAASFPKEAEGTFEDSLLDHLRHLSVAAFVRPRAGMAFLEDPLGHETLGRSTGPVWLCAVRNDAYSYDLLIGDNTYSGDGPSAKRACRAIEGAAEDTDLSVLRTIPDVRVELRQEVHLSSASTLEGMTWAHHLVPLPKGATFKKGTLAKRTMSGGATGFRDGAFWGHEGRFGGIERDVRLPQASVELEGAPMWITRWTFDAMLERFGQDPERQPYPRKSLLVAVAPIADPLMGEADRGRTDLSVPTSALEGAVVARFLTADLLGPSVVSDVLADPAWWPWRGDWLVVTCRDDGTARYGIVPFVDAAPVDNAREACAAIRRGTEE
jgi:hypothetical protein